MKKIILLLSSIALSNLASAAETLTIGLAHALPDYTKLVATYDTIERGFIVAFAPGDFNEDGRLDLVVQTGDTLSPGFTPWGAKVFLQDSNGGFQEKNEYLLPTIGITWDFVPGDFNEDGHLDILMEEADRDMLLLRGNGDGTFREPSFLGLSAAGFFAVGDVNGDRHLDIMAGKLDGGVGVFVGAGDGTFTLKSTLAAAVTPSFPRLGKVLLGDLNKDGRTDVVVGSRPGGPLVGVLEVFFGNGDGTFQEAVQTPKVAARQGALGDFNGDGTLDYAGSGGTPEQLQIWFGQTDGRFSRGSVHSLSGAFTYADGVRVADVNYDGISDVLVVGQISSTVYAGPISIFLGRGDGKFQPRIAFTQANGTRTITSAGPQLLDFDGDGFLDILSLCWTAGQPRIREALMIARSKGVKRDSQLGFLVGIEGTGPPQSLILERTENLADWSGIATNCCPAPAGKWLITDPSPTTGQRFYRTRGSGVLDGHP